MTKSHQLLKRDKKKICKFKWKKRHNIMKKIKKKVDSVDEKGQTSKKGGTLVKKG